MSSRSLHASSRRRCRFVDIVVVVDGARHVGRFGWQRSIPEDPEVRKVSWKINGTILNPSGLEVFLLRQFFS